MFFDRLIRDNEKIPRTSRWWACNMKIKIEQERCNEWRTISDAFKFESIYKIDIVPTVC
jgi:hypothetical protein